LVLAAENLSDAEVQIELSALDFATSPRPSQGLAAGAKAAHPWAGRIQPPEDTAEERHARAGMMRAAANLLRAATEQELL